MKDTPPLDAQIAFYDTWHTKHRTGGFNELECADKELYSATFEVFDIIQSLALKQPRILEMGCGTGWLSEKLCNFGTVTGIDLSPKAIAIAKQRGCSAEFIAADILTYDQPLGLFDLVVACDTLFYVSDQIVFMDKIAKLVKPGGFLILVTINSFVYERRSDIPPPANGQVRTWLTRRQLIKLCDQDYIVRISKAVVPPIKGDKGILRLVNSFKLNRLLGCFFSMEAVNNLKVKLGLGDRLIIVAQRKNSMPV